MKSKREMIRVLKTVDDEFVLDTTGKKNGRGAYLCFSKECFEQSMPYLIMISGENIIFFNFKTNK